MNLEFFSFLILIGLNNLHQLIANNYERKSLTTAKRDLVLLKIKICMMIEQEKTPRQHLSNITISKSNYADKIISYECKLS